MLDPFLTGSDLLELNEELDVEAQQRARSRLPLVIPWHPDETIRLGSMLRSWVPGDPWSKTSPFQPDSLNAMPVVVSRELGTDATFRSQSTSSTSQTKDHMSLGFGVGVGIPFLAEVSVSGRYDRDVTENRDANKISIRVTNRAGYVAFQRQPLLTTEGIIAIKYDGGITAFHERYGDYYVAGYRLGGDTGLMLSGSDSVRSELEQFGLTLKIKVLLIEKSKTFTKDSASSSQASVLSLTAYDTLDSQHWSLSKGQQNISAEEVQQRGADVMKKSQMLDTRVQDKMDELNITDGDVLSFEDCDRLTKAGLVVELVLLPVISLRQVILWLQEDNVI